MELPRYTSSGANPSLHTVSSDATCSLHKKCSGHCTGLLCSWTPKSGLFLPHCGHVWTLHMAFTPRKLVLLFFFFWRNASYFPYLLTPSLPKPQGLPVSSRRAPLNPPTPPARWGLQHQAPIASVPTSSISLHTLHWSPLLLQFPIRLWAL